MVCDPQLVVGQPRRTRTADAVVVVVVVVVVVRLGRYAAKYLVLGAKSGLDAMIVTPMASFDHSVIC